MTVRPGSFAWLLANDLRLNWRRFADMLGRPRTPALLAILVAGAVILHAIAWPAVAWLAPQVHGAGAPSLLLVAALVSGFSWMMAQSLFGASRTLYDRGDLDLLLGSPLSHGRIFAAKAAAVASGTFGSIAFLTLPLANVGALVDRAAWLGIYPVLLGLALLATAIGLGLSILLFFAFRPRRARIYTQLTGAVIGGSLVLAIQIFAMLPAGAQAAVEAAIAGAGVTGDGMVATWLRLPVAAVRGDLAAMVTVVGVGGVAFLAATLLLGDRFARASLAAAGAPASEAISRRKDRAFLGGLAANMRCKEWRLLRRDPSLFAQIGLQIIYTVPVAVVLMRSDTIPTALALAPTIVVIAAQVAASLAWLTVSGEDAPELIATAPVVPGMVERAKLSAVALPVLVVMALPLAGLMLLSVKVAAVTFAFSAAAATATSLLNFWHPMPGNRRGMLRRHTQSKLVGLVEHVLAILFAVAVVFVFLGTWLWLAPCAIASAILALVRWRHLRGDAIGVVRARIVPAHPEPAVPGDSVRVNP